MSRARTVAFVLLFAAVAVSASAATVAAQEDADLVVVQQDYIDGDVNHDAENNIYIGKGPEVSVIPQNFDHSDVRDYGVISGGDASISWDDRTRRYTFSASEDGTYDVFWSVEETQTVGGNNTTSTETAETRYTASIRLQQTGIVVMTESNAQELRDRAETGEEITQRFEQAGDPDASVESKVAQGEFWVNFWHSPFGGIAEILMGIVALLFFSARGLLVTALLAVLIAVGYYKPYRRLHVYEKIMPEVEEVEAEAMRVEAEKIENSLIADDWSNDLGPEQSLQMKEDVGNKRQWLDILDSVVSKEDVTKITLHMHSQLGYGVREADDGYELVKDATDEERNRLKAIWGDADGDFEMEEPEIEDMVAYFVGEDLDVSIYDHPETNIMDASEVPADVDSDGDFMDKLGMEGDAWESDEHLIRQFAKICENIAESPLTDDEGRIKADRSLVAFLASMTRKLSEQHGIPMKEYAIVFEKTAEEMDADSRMESQLDTVADGGVGS